MVHRVKRSMFGDTDPQRTPVQTPIVLNPKVNGEDTVLCCPECGEEIECWTSNHETPLVEYRCGCEELRRFRVKGVDG